MQMLCNQLYLVHHSIQDLFKIINGIVYFHIHNKIQHIQE